MNSLARKIMAVAWRVLCRAGLVGLGLLLAAPTGAATSPAAEIKESDSEMSQSGTKCSLSATVSPKEFGAEGGTGTLLVKPAKPGRCPWQASSHEDWIKVIDGKGDGPGEATFKVLANPETKPRQGTLSVGTKRLSIRQKAALCQAKLAPTSLGLPAAGGEDAFGIEAEDGCRWRAKSQVPWLRLGKTSGSGAAKVVVTAKANPDPAPRSGQIEVGDQILNVSQAAGACSIALSPASHSLAAAGGEDTFRIQPSHDSCLANPVSQAPWLRITSTMTAVGVSLPAGHQRNMTVQFDAEANPSASQRVGKIKVGDEVFTVTQAAGTCSIALSPASQTATAAATSGSFRVQPSHDSCLAGPVSQADWLDIDTTMTAIGVSLPEGQQRSMNVQFTAQANPSPSQRVGKIKVGGEYFTVTQSAGTCSVTMTPASQALSAAGGEGVFRIQPGHDACLANPVSEAGWINVYSTMTAIGASLPEGHQRSMTVQFTAQANSATSPRSGRIKVGSQYFTVSQAAAPCAFTLADSALALGMDGGKAVARVTANAPTCSWSVQGLPAWLTITAQSSGQGSGSVEFSAGPNTQVQGRSATLQVGGKPVTVTQAGATGCQFQVSPANANAAANVSANTPPVGYVVFNLVANHLACTWQATSQAAWLSVETPSGNGSGQVRASYDTNPSTAARTGQLTLAGQAVTVTQAGDRCRVAGTLLNPSVPGADTSDAILRVAANGPACGWAARSNYESREWLGFPDITGQYQPGQGPRDVRFRAARNLMASPRQAQLELFDANSSRIGQYTLTQEAGPCRFGVDIGVQTHGYELGSAVVNLVANGSQCAWQAGSDVPWLQIVGLNQGQGSHQVTYMFHKNEGSAQRSGNLTIGGNRIRINQLGKP